MACSRCARRFSAYLMATTLCILSSVRVHAQEDAVIPPPAVEEAAVTEDAGVTVPEIQPQPAVTSQGCSEGGLAQAGGDELPAFYTSSMASVTRDAAGIQAAMNSGAISLGGAAYRLVRIELPRDGVFALSGVRYERHARLVHEAENGALIVAIVPLREGAANRTVEEMLTKGDAPRLVEPGALLAPQTGWARLDGCVAGAPEPRLILSPVEISAEQAARLAQAL